MTWLNIKIRPKKNDFALENIVFSAYNKHEDIISYS